MYWVRRSVLLMPHLKLFPLRPVCSLLHGGQTCGRGNAAKEKKTSSSRRSPCLPPQPTLFPMIQRAFFDGLPLSSRLAPTHFITSDARNTHTLGSEFLQAFIYPNLHLLIQRSSFPWQPEPINSHLHRRDRPGCYHSVDGLTLA